MLLVGEYTKERLWKAEELNVWGPLSPCFPRQQWRWQVPSRLGARASPHSMWKGEIESRDLSLPGALTSRLCSWLLELLLLPLLFSTANVKTESFFPPCDFAQLLQTGSHATTLSGVSAPLVTVSTWILCHDVQNSCPLFFHRISQGKITHII